ncbi:ribosome maturation factor RimM [Auritidibacter ignavus]|uniref:ribosome maturation factor RimM n=1 Tax=Auritidibacter ignavus TaxID=678932 RepID=UPI0024B93BA5|nr:ribosome maturation factor RimM [Auritidibacter ignavus]WHS28188.1 ribosome maturation factor RimM [Auritidibacter ignavus]
MDHDTLDGLVRVARIGKPHGIKGDVTVQIFTDSPETRFVPGAVLTVDHGGTESPLAGRLTVHNARWNKHILLLSFEEISDRNLAEQYRNCHLYAEPEDLEDDDDAWYAEDLADFTVKLDSAEGETIGTISDLIPGEAQDLLEVTRTNGTTSLVPFVVEIVPEIDVDQQLVILTPPAGLLELGQD